MSNPNFKLFDAVADLERSVKAHHGAVAMMAECESMNENIYYTFCGIGDALQQRFN